ncbi:MAG: double zinc ribbon domain-containing protein [Gaiellaceae bacterium]
MLLDLILPRRCAGCARAGIELCEACLAALPRLRHPLCARCGAPTLWPVRRCRECAGRRLAFATARSALAYDESVRRIVAGWKEHALRGLAAIAATLVAELIPRPAVDAIAFVPADPDRGLKRGHDPPAALAALLAERWELPVIPMLERRSPAPRQRGLALPERRRNVRDAFAACRAPPTRVVLVDDVYTTGATASEAARSLLRAGARRVEVVTLARAIRRA